MRLDARGRIVIDGFRQTTAQGVYAAGDVVDPGLASYAMQQGRAAAAHACGLMVRRGGRPDPQHRRLRPARGRRRGGTRGGGRATGTAYVVGRCDLALTARGAIAGHGGLLKLIIRADDRTLLGVHCFGDIASEVVNLGHVVVQSRGSVESFLTLALATPTYGYAYHDAAVDGLIQLSLAIDRRTAEHGRAGAVRSAARRPHQRARAALQRCGGGAAARTIQF